MNQKEYEEQCEKMFWKVSEVLDDSRTMVVCSVAINLLRNCLLSMDKDLQKKVASGVVNMFSEVNEISMGRKKLEN